MKMSVVPAQVTTVEDRIVGKIGLSQLLLLVAPVFGASILYVLLPPNMHSSLYKTVTILMLVIVCSALAIRIKGKIILLWFIILIQYGLRPRLYVFDKNCAKEREILGFQTFAKIKSTALKPEAQKSTNFGPILTACESSRALRIINNPATHNVFEFNKKGVLNGSIHEVDA